ncbi:hypothetical protein RE476_02795 [Methanolobus mangrovi]|uniref:Uncharacterized protein n=1 Tax=Methanolobus mangrovi TaxID=3072977 RepID=A0AA51UGC5_9EURY|nr:hypothetical protein [Methanolobus mangrovi]WMW22767.1 hypothetical protein RE476_02795 [Methanolobus mangrovi]
MGRSKSGGYAGRPVGSTKDRNWLSEGHQERRFNHAMDFCKLTLGQTRDCPICNHQTAKCIDAGVTKGMGARSWWKCECGHQFIKSISPERMAEYYSEDLEKMIESRRTTHDH